MPLRLIPEPKAIVLEHNENRTSPYYLLSVELCNKVYQVLLRYQLVAGQVRNRVQGDLLSAFLIFQHMSFRDVVADIYLFTQERYNKNVLVRTGESLFGVDARTVGELTARLGEAYDSLQMGSIERSFIGTLHRL
ncbi:hypothetical protein WG66_016309 [Moniliophthora roreri]|nr:hypothetical protein WG66_003995 [Moniliophthora roreri]KAI3612103.1 hypothetical protein WG66_016309 [Moniliophthora roreri]